MKSKEELIEELIEVDGPNKRDIVDAVNFKTTLNDLRSRAVRKMIEKSLINLKEKLKKDFGKGQLLEILESKKNDKELDLDLSTRYISTKRIAVNEAAEGF